MGGRRPLGLLVGTHACTGCRVQWAVLGCLVFLTFFNIWRNRLPAEDDWKVKRKDWGSPRSMAENKRKVFKPGDDDYLHKIGELYASKNPGGRLMKGIYEDDIAHMKLCTYCRAAEDYGRGKAAASDSLGILEGMQSFVDDYLISLTTNAIRFLQKPVELDQPVIAASKRWENMIGEPGTTNYNGTHFIMHYVLMKHGLLKGTEDIKIWGSRADELIAFASSTDGISWEKRKITFHETDMGHEGLMHAPGGSSCVLLDEHPRDPMKRYIMTYGCTTRSKNAFKFDNLYEYSYTHRRPPQHTCLATSPDGINWIDHGRKFGMTAIKPCLYHETKGGNYTFILRKDFHTKVLIGQIHGAQILTISEEQFDKFLARDGPLPFELQNEFYLDRDSKNEIYKHVVHGLSREFKIGDVHIGVADVHHWPYLPDMGDWKKKIKKPWPHETILPYFVTSRDGIHFDFTKIYENEFIPLGEKDDLQYILTSAKAPTVNGYHWIYYAGRSEKLKKRYIKENPIRLAKFEEGRVSGFRPEHAEEHAKVETKKFSISDEINSIKLNVALETTDASCEVILKREGSAQQSLKTVHFGAEPLCVSIHNNGKQMQLIFKLYGSAKLYGFTLSKNGCSEASSLESR